MNDLLIFCLFFLLAVAFWLIVFILNKILAVESVLKDHRNNIENIIKYINAWQRQAKEEGE